MKRSPLPFMQGPSSSSALRRSSNGGGGSTRLIYFLAASAVLMMAVPLYAKPPPPHHHVLNAWLVPVNHVAGTCCIESIRLRQWLSPPPCPPGSHGQCRQAAQGLKV